MKINKILKEIIYVIIFTMLFSNNIYASNYYREFNGSEQMVKILEEKQLKGKINIPPEIKGENDGDIDTSEEGKRLWEEHAAIYDRKKEREKVVRETINGTYEIDNKENFADNNQNNKMFILFILLIVMIIAFISFKFKKKKILLLEVAVVIISILVYNNYFSNNKNYNTTNEILDYIKGEVENKELDEYANQYKIEYIDKYNEREVDISKVINDYIIKCYYCVKRKANDKELYTTDLVVLNCFDDKIHNYDLTYGEKYVNLLKWKDIDSWLVVNNLLSKESMKGIYDNLTEEDIENFHNGIFLDKLIEKIDYQIKSKNDFDAYSVVPYNYFNIVRLDEEPLYKCKYWYMDTGEDTIIELPYGAKFEYNIAKFEEKNIKKFEKAEIIELEKDPIGEKTLFAYYVDNEDNKEGAYTTIYENGLYNKKELTDKIKLANINIYTDTKNYEVGDIEEDIKELNRIICYAVWRSQKENRTDERYTKAFLDKYKENGIMPPKYDQSSLLNLTNHVISEENVIENKFFYRLTLDNDYAIFKLKWKDDKVDDIEYYIIPEDKKHLSYEEMYQLAFN